MVQSLPHVRISLFAPDRILAVLRDQPLAEVVAYLKRVEHCQQERDYTFSNIGQADVIFDREGMFLLHNDERMRFTRTAGSQAARELLPSHMWPGFRELARLNPDTATQAWLDFRGSVEKGAPTRILRTVRARRADGEIERRVRAVVSDSYARIPGSLVLDMMRSYGDVHVDRFTIGDDYHHGSFTVSDALQARLLATLGREDLGVTGHLAYQNSETACAAISIRPMIAVPGTDPGQKVQIAHWVTEAALRSTWRHAGRVNRIRFQIRQTVDDTARLLVDLGDVYARGREIKAPVNDAGALVKRAAESTSKDLLDRFQHALKASQQTEISMSDLATRFGALAREDQDEETKAGIAHDAGRILHKGIARFAA